MALQCASFIAESPRPSCAAGVAFVSVVSIGVGLGESLASAMLTVIAHRSNDTDEACERRAETVWMNSAST